MSASIYSAAGVLRELWDDKTRTVTYYDEQGNQTSNRTYTPDEVAVADSVAVAEAANKNKSTIEQQAEGALVTNSDYIALANPTNAQVAAQVKALTRQNNKIIRMMLGKFDSTE